MQSFPSDRDIDIKANVSILSRAKQGCPFCRLIIPRWEVGLHTLNDDIAFNAVVEVKAGVDMKVIEGFRGQGKKRELVFVAEEGKLINHYLSTFV